MKTDRPAGMGIGLGLGIGKILGITTLDPHRRLSNSDRRDPSSPQIQADAAEFDTEFSRSLPNDDEDTSSEQDDETPTKPFDLIPTLPFVATPAVAGVPYAALIQVVQETVQELFVSQDDKSRRQVSMTLADSILPGVTLSMYEQDGRIVGDFMCVDEQSRDRLCDVAERMVVELANQLSRDARIYVRSDDEEDIYHFQVDATPEQRPADSAIDDGLSSPSKEGEL